MKAAFELMGYSYENTLNKPSESLTGEVVFRKKHIRLHNRVLKMKHHNSKHIYFDDDRDEVQVDENVNIYVK